MIAIRRALPKDAELVAQFINELAEYEQLGTRSRPNVERLATQLDPEAQWPLYCYIAEDTNAAVGFALSYLAYSTFWTDWYLHLEDFFVREEARGTGAGFRLFREVSRTALELGVQQVDLEVLKWNTLATEFYERLGGERDDEWIRYRFKPEILTRLVPA